MPQVARIGDSFVTGHPCDGVSEIGEGSGNVFANGIPVSRRGDRSVPHLRLVGGVCVPHVAPIVEGSATVFANGIPVARIGDPIDAGSITGGSPNVWAGD
ncbi:PAAR domain-containing protein [Myxococcota bacterium]|nr:PAAR domain-containing protein [Myxococcota bacterium]